MQYEPLKKNDFIGNILCAGSYKQRLTTKYDKKVSETTNN